MSLSIPLHFLIVALCATFSAPLQAALQSSDQAQELERVIARLHQLEKEEQAQIAERVLFSAFPEQVVPLRRALEVLRWAHSENCTRKPLTPPPVYLSSDYAPALKMRDRRAKTDSSRWKEFFPDLEKRAAIATRGDHWWWSRGQHTLFHPVTEQTAEAVIRALWQGNLADPSHLIAAVEARLDRTLPADPVAAYFEHGYRDRDGYRFDWVRLEDVWDSGRTFGISDVESIAFLREVAHDSSLSSPIPKSRHQALYRRIEEAWVPYRDQRNLRRALAIRFLDLGVAVPPVMRGQEPWLDIAWALVDHNPDAIAALMAAHPGRDAFLSQVQQLASNPPCGAETLALRREVRTTTKAWMAWAAREALRQEGLILSP